MFAGFVVMFLSTLSKKHEKSNDGMATLAYFQSLLVAKASFFFSSLVPFKASDRRVRLYQAWECWPIGIRMMQNAVKPWGSS